MQNWFVCQPTQWVRNWISTKKRLSFRFCISEQLQIKALAFSGTHQIQFFKGFADDTKRSLIFNLQKGLQVASLCRTALCARSPESELWLHLLRELLSQNHCSELENCCLVFPPQVLEPFARSTFAERKKASGERRFRCGFQQISSIQRSENALERLSAEQCKHWHTTRSVGTQKSTFKRKHFFFVFMKLKIYLQTNLWKILAILTCLYLYFNFFLLTS